MIGRKVAIAPSFTAQDIKLIGESLPNGINKQRLRLLPKILREWAKTDLPTHLSMPPAIVRRDRIERLKAVGDFATKLSAALDIIEKGDDQFWLIQAFVAKDGQRLNQATRHKQEVEYQSMRAYLNKLSTSSATSRKLWQQGKGQPRNVTASFVLMDIIAIYEWLTDKKATRQVDRDNNKETGPFWEFAAVIWSLVFDNGQRGLSAAMKNWQSATKKRLTGTRSALIHNIAVRYPAWGIFKD